MNGSANVRCDRNELALVSGGVHVGAARHPDKVAVIMAGDGLTYRSLATRMRQLSAAACAAGVQPGDRVAVIAPNCLEYVELVCGLSDVGAVVVTLSARYTSREIAEVCADCRPRLVIYHPDCESAITQVQFKGVEHVIRLGEEYEHWLADAPPLEDCPRVDPDSPFCLVYSSGTTGKPKGVLISHRSRVLTFHAMAMEYGCYGPDDLHLGLAPMAHGAGFAFIMAAVYFGGTVELMPRFDPEALVRWLAEKPFTGVFAVPAHFSAVFALPGSVLSRWRGQARTLRTIISNASALPQALKERIVDYWGENLLHETYGSTEAGIVTNLRPADQLLRKQCVGRPFALTYIKLLDEDGLPVAMGEVGELYSRSPYLFEGYFANPQLSAQVTRDGWITAGDLARQDADGFYYIVDRKKDMIISGGFNVYPREVEEQLVSHPAVSEAAVVGVPDERWGEVLRAFVVLRQGVPLPTAEQLEQHCRERLANYKVPRSYVFVNGLPRTASGKIIKTELRHGPHPARAET